MALFGTVRGHIRKAQAAVVIEKLLEASGALPLLPDSPHKMANVLVAAVCDGSPGLASSLPNKMTLAIAALSLGMGGAEVETDLHTVLRGCVIDIENHILGRGKQLGLGPADVRLLEWSETVRAANLRR